MIAMIQYIGGKLQWCTFDKEIYLKCKHIVAGVLQNDLKSWNIWKVWKVEEEALHCWMSKCIFSEVYFQKCIFKSVFFFFSKVYFSKVYFKSVFFFKSVFSKVYFYCRSGRACSHRAKPPSVFSPLTGWANSYLFRQPSTC